MKIIKLFLLLICIVCMAGCANKKDREVVYNIDQTASFWDEHEVEEAMNVVETFFLSDEGFKRCELHEIRYSTFEDEKSQALCGEIPNKIFLSTYFRTKAFTAYEGWNPLSDYIYSWTLIKNDGSWEIESYGMP
ncbi:MAG: hypothetical protein ACI4TK_07895 [Agathobacter sp.]